MNRDNQSVVPTERTLDLPRRSWRCLRDDVIAAYVDGGLDDRSLEKTQSHLADCHACRSLVADVMAMRRLETLQPPFGLKERAFSTAVPRRKQAVLIPAFAVAAAACVIAAIFLVQGPQKLDLIRPNSPTAPMIAKSELPPGPRSNSDVVRKLATPEITPKILFPLENANVKRSQLHFSWNRVSRAQYYEIHVVSPEGDPVWKGESKANSLELPGDVALSDGSYFVWIDAVAEGQIRKSVPVRFLVRNSP